MPMHFDEAEYQARRARATGALRHDNLDALLMFAPESHYWICGYDTFGFALTSPSTDTLSDTQALKARLESTIPVAILPIIICPLPDCVAL